MSSAIFLRFLLKIYFGRWDRHLLYDLPPQQIYHTAIWEKAPGSEYMTNTLPQTSQLIANRNCLAYEQIDKCEMGERSDVTATDERCRIDCWFVENNSRIAGDIKEQRKIPCAPLTPQQANMPCSHPDWDSSDFLNWLKATVAPFWEGQQLSRIRIESMHRGGDIPLHKYIRQGDRLDLGTMLANLATTTWVEGALITRNTDYSLKVCQVHPRPQWTKDEKSIPNPYNVVPRRLWDLVNNRVVDIDVFAKRGENGEIISPRMPAGGYWAISHSWTADMQRWMTPVNNYRWPVPLPTGATLEDIRWEALRAGAVYCWLDVLCLRQRMEECSYRLRDIDGEEVLDNYHHQDCSESQHTEVNQQRRLDEWALDVPTIGNNYRQSTFVLRYFNGLGRSLSLSGWENPRHWINRAWTLQESRPEHIMVNACIPSGMQLPLQAIVEITGERRPIQRFLLPLARLIQDAEAEYVPHRPMLERALPLWVGSFWLEWRGPRTIPGTIAATFSSYACLRLELNLVGLVVSVTDQCYVNGILRTTLWRCLRSPLPVWKIALWFVEAIVFHYGGKVVAQKGWELVPISAKRLQRKINNICSKDSALRDILVVLVRVTAMPFTGVAWRTLRHCFSMLVGLIIQQWPGSCAVGFSLVPLDAALTSPAYKLWLVLSLIALLAMPHGYPGELWDFLPLLTSVVAERAYTCSEYWNSEVWPRLLLLQRVLNPVRQPRRFCSILALAQEMSRREASNERDKIAGLGYLMKCTNLPIYAEEEPLEDAWLHLVSHLPYPAQLELLFNFPRPRGRGNEVHGTWIPKWKQVTSMNPDASLELQRPSWPPSWLLEKNASTPPKLLVSLSHSKLYDEPSRALLVPCCGRVLLCTEIRHIAAGLMGQRPGVDSKSPKLGPDSYAVTITTTLVQSKTLIHYFYCPHNESLLLENSGGRGCTPSQPVTLISTSQDSHIYLLISHGRDDEAGTLSWVVGRVMQPRLRGQSPGDAFRDFYNPIAVMDRLRGELNPEIRKITMDVFGLTEGEAIRTLVVEKIGVLVTDDMRPLTAPDMNIQSCSMSNVPVVFV